VDKYDNIPLELRSYNSWCVWRYEDTEAKKPTKVPYDPRSGIKCDITNVSSGCAFAEAILATRANGKWSGIGFIVSEINPYGFIDIDYTDDSTALGKQLEVYEKFQSYTERSPSGKGCHILFKGKIPSGRRRKFIEIYSDNRYMTFTGDIVRNLPIVDCTLQANELFLELGEGKHAISFYGGLEAPIYTDERVLEIASSASNAEKFDDLYYKGEWEKYYQSQSEADYALIDILAFYSQNKQQVHNLFLKSKLGQRQKANRSDYVGPMLARCFDRMPPPIDIDGVINEFNAVIAEKKKAKTLSAVIETPSASPELPPGLLGEIAKYIYAAAPRPVPEIALAGAIGLMAGICGRAYNVSGTGLNQYVILLAKTGTGKEAMASGINKLITAAIKLGVRDAGKFIGPGTISSREALNKVLVNTPSILCIVGEFGIALHEMSRRDAAPHKALLLQIYLDLYNKSGRGDVLNWMAYSERAKTIDPVISPAFSLLGESTPETFLESLDEMAIKGGLVPRLFVMEYLGPRVALNENINAIPSTKLIHEFGSLCAHSLQLNDYNNSIDVQFTSDASNVFSKFNTFCDSQINSSENSFVREFWSRAYMKAMKLASLWAVGLNYILPIIEIDSAHWATNMIHTEVKSLLGRFDTGAFGANREEIKQSERVVEVMRNWIVKPWDECEGQADGKGNREMHNAKVIPKVYIQKNTSAYAAFRNDKMGASFALKRALGVLLDNGQIQKLPPSDLANKFGARGEAFIITNMKTFNL